MERRLRACYCGEPLLNPYSKWITGHDGKMRGDIIQAVGGMDNLKTIVEHHLGRAIPRVRRPAPIPTIRRRRRRT